MAGGAGAGVRVGRVGREVSTRLLRLGAFEQAGDRDQATIHGIGSQPEALEREHTEDRFGARLTEYADRGLRARSDPDLYPRHGVADLASVSQNERPVLVRHDAQALQHVAGATAQIAGVVPRSIVLPANLLGRERTVMILPERVAHIRHRRPEWLAFCLAHIPNVLAAPDYIGQRVHGDRRRVEFVGLVGRPPRWLLVSVKFLDEKGEAWVD